MSTSAPRDIGRGGGFRALVTVAATKTVVTKPAVIYIAILWEKPYWISEGETSGDFRGFWRMRCCKVPP